MEVQIRKSNDYIKRKKSWEFVAAATRRETRQRLSLVNFDGRPFQVRRYFTRIALFAIAVSLVNFLALKPATITAATNESNDDVDKSLPKQKHDKADLRKEPNERIRPENLILKIIRSDSKEPVSEAEIEVNFYANNRSLIRKLKTDTDGLATFEYPDGEGAADLSATVYCKGLVPYYVNFGRNLIPTALPTQKTIQMSPGKRIGGMIVDQDGKPVSGAQLSISIPATDTPFEIYYYLLYEKTGDDGAWMLDGAPLKTDLGISIEHPRFIKSWFRVKDAIDGRYELDPGLTISGRVLDTDGKPVPNARITEGRDRWGSVGAPIRADKEGAFGVYALKPQPTWVTVEAPGYVPEIRSVQVQIEKNPVIFHLKPGHSTRFKVVNDNGEPLAGVIIVADTWQGFRTLWWETKTDVDGLATWDGAPVEAVKFHILGGGGYAALRETVVGPRAEPHQIVLPKALIIEGTVTDSQKQKIPEFRVVPGRKFSDPSKITWMTFEGVDCRDGKLQIQYFESCEEIYLRIEADGFKPWVSDAISFHKSKHKLLVKLEKED